MISPRKGSCVLFCIPRFLSIEQICHIKKVSYIAWTIISLIFSTLLLFGNVVIFVTVLWEFSKIWQTYSEVANRRGKTKFFEIFPTPIKLVGTPAYWFSQEIFWSRRLYSWLAVFSIISKRRLPYFYLMHIYLVSFIYWP